METSLGFNFFFCKVKELITTTKFYKQNEIEFVKSIIVTNLS